MSKITHPRGGHHGHTGPADPPKGNHAELKSEGKQVAKETAHGGPGKGARFKNALKHSAVRSGKRHAKSAH